MAAERKISTRIELKGDAEYRRRMAALNKDMQTFSGWAGTMAGVLAAKAITKGLEALASGFKEAFDASVEFETALTGVAKTTTMSDVQLEAFGQRMQELSTQIPISATELLNLAEAAGQLGIADKDLERFVEIVAAMGVSTNMSADEVATAFAQIGNIMGTSVYDYERMGSSIVALGNKSAATESQITELSLRFAGAANQIGVTEADMLAYATAMASVGIEAEAGGSALSKTWREIETLVATGGDNLKGFAQAAGMSATEFSRAWSEDASGAFMSFMAGLGDADANGQSAIAMLSDLGITEIRQVDTLTRLIGASDSLTQLLDISNTAWDENTALSEEAGRFYGTTASQIEMAENAVNNLAIAAGDKFKPLVVDAMKMGQGAVEALTAAIVDQPSLAEIAEGADATYRAQADEIENAARKTSLLVDRLDELGDATSMTREEQQEYLAILELIKRYMPGAAGIIDQQTGAIEGGTEALRENIDASAENARQTAELDAAREKYDALVIAQENLANKRAIYALAVNDVAEKEAAYNALLDEQDALYAEAEAAAKRLNEENGTNLTAQDMLVRDFADAQAELGTQMGAAADEMGRAQDYAKGLNDEITRDAAEIEAAAGYAAEYEAELSNMGAAYERAAEGSGAVSEAMQQQIDDFQAMDDRVAELNAQVVAAMEITRAQVAEVINGFGAIEMPETVSATDTIANLQTQLDYMKTYSENLKKVQEMGLDQQLVLELSDGSAESAAVLQGIVDDGGTSIDALNAKFAEVTASKDTMAEEMALAVTDYDTKTDLIIAATNKMVDNFNQEDGAKAAAAATIQAVIDGMNSKLALLRTTAAKINALMKPGGGSTGTKTNGAPEGTYASGLAYVPADGYVAELHRGEMVLTALEARAYRAEQYANYGMLDALARDGDTHVQNDNSKAYTRGGDTYNFDNNITLPEPRSAKQLLDEINAYGRRRARGRGRILG